MDLYRLYHSLRLSLIVKGKDRAKYIQKNNLFYHMGDDCMVMLRKLPLYSQLIDFGDNVWVASNVLFITHDVIHNLLNNKMGTKNFLELAGCIKVNDNVFIGSNSTILPNVSIGPNSIIAAGSIVNKSLDGNGVYGGVPARYLCSFDEFIKKRATNGQIKLEKVNGQLTNETIKKLWDSFNIIEER